MALIRRNPAAAFEQGDTAAVATAAPVQAGSTSTPEKTPEQRPAPQNQPAPPGHTPRNPGQTDTSFPKNPSEATHGAEVTGQATAQGVSVALQRANSGAVTTRIGKIPTVMEDLKNAFTVDFDTFDRLKAGAGVIVDSNNNNLGRDIAMTVLSWQDTYDVAPGSDAPEAKKVVRYSDDGVTLAGGGGLVRDYLASLMSGEVDGVKYPNANCKQKCVLVGILEGAENPTNLLGQTVQVSLSNQSRKFWDRHRFNITMAIQMGRRASAEGAECITIKAVPTTSNGNNYTLLHVSEDTGA